MILLVRDGREFLCAPGDEVHTDLGVVDVPTDVSPGDVVESHLGESFAVRALRGPDLFQHLERTGAPMMPKDVGLVIGHTGAAAGDQVLDAGTGTGVLAAYLARVGAEVRTFEEDPEFAAVARENMDLAEVADRVTVQVGDVTDHLDDASGFDLVTLDTADAVPVVERAQDLLVSGGFVAVYSPFVESAREVELAAREAGLESIETVETIQREMDFDDRGSRPATRGVGHTGYLTFGRKL
ncbi:methyltransferase domain-containing protein [Halanaeroarchaeum sulfurireducens]|uniref:tRNA (Adenine(57)-N(1)/adenine(58)-N(1))-methyltransferase n=1 Tax=Halanaeroarchaeum sulfurireducens TaxID=1604004 RepID=A0A0F7PC80_9EURY|nr:tRNA (adenine(57)-N(1)/adenine(58)-N(1))-methyltransferase [Halanaeroarchaeum sulfurireducens]ALG81621.1 tRNA (adenine(57)-N(1)/adenine(58)-N(1))-methyltransferase [Halanaeroarchaeum sulfurireducens]